MNQKNQKFYESHSKTIHGFIKKEANDENQIETGKQSFKTEDVGLKFQNFEEMHVPSLFSISSPSPRNLETLSDLVSKDEFEKNGESKFYLSI